MRLSTWYVYFVTSFRFRFWFCILWFFFYFLEDFFFIHSWKSFSKKKNSLFHFAGKFYLKKSLPNFIFYCYMDRITIFNFKHTFTTKHNFLLIRIKHVFIDVRPYELRTAGNIFFKSPSTNRMRRYGLPIGGLIFKCKFNSDCNYKCKSILDAQARRCGF